MQSLAERFSEAVSGIKHPTAQGFMLALVQAAEMFAKKNLDYGTDADPLRNIRGSAAIGIKPWLGSWLRARDKVGRIDTYCMKGSLANEGVEDSFVDLAVYSLICLVLFREQSAR